MYVEVLFTFLKVISTFLIGLIGFSLVFYILLKKQGNFSEFWLALAKVHVMMIGELEYTDILVENIVNNNTVPGTDVPYVPLPILTFLLFLMFILMVSIVLVNLLVGLAVGDIEAIRKTASLRSLIDQVLLVNHIMKSYPRFILRRAHRSFLEIKPNQNTFINRVALAGCDLTDGDFVDKLLSQESGTDTSSEIWHMKEMQDERRDEMIQKLQATVEAQGKLLQAMADRLKIAV
ncbi:transient receptor potential cation channel subfamily A member 1-like [Oculina patagonica]